MYLSALCEDGRRAKNISALIHSLFCGLRLWFDSQDRAFHSRQAFRSIQGRGLVRTVSSVPCAELVIAINARMARVIATFDQRLFSMTGKVAWTKS